MSMGQAPTGSNPEMPTEKTKTKGAKTMDGYEVTLYGVDSYTGYPAALTYRLEAPDVDTSVNLARLTASRSYPEFVEDYELYKERMGEK